MILVTHSLTQVARFIFVKIACFFFVERLHDFFVWRGCVILCVKRLHDFSHTLTQSLRLHVFFCV